jgi:hypothetical protein
MGPTVSVAESLRVRPPVLRMRHDAFGRAPGSRPSGPASVRITFGAIGAALCRIVGRRAGNAGTGRRWHDTVRRDCGEPDIVAALLLRLAAQANPPRLVLFSSIRPQRVQQAAVALATEETHDLGQLAALVAAELRDCQPGAAAAQ